MKREKKRNKDVSVHDIAVNAARTRRRAMERLMAGIPMEAQQSLGEEIIEGLTELTEVVESGQPLRQRFRVDEWTTNEARRQYDC